MARIWSCGFELNSLVSGHEFTSVANSPSISSTTFRSGAYAGRITSLSSGTRKIFNANNFSIDTDGPVFGRAYFNVATLPSAANHIMTLRSTGGVNIVILSIDNTGALQLLDEDGAIGSPVTLSLDTWYRLELKMDRTAAAGSHVTEARLDGSVFATSSSRDLSAGIDRMWLGGNLAAEAQTTGDWFFDDAALNDSSDPGDGSQMSYPGNGKIVHLRPNGSGDNAADLGAFTDIDEITPNDATDFIDLDTATSIGDYNVDASSTAGIDATDIITLVSVGVRIREESSAVTSYQLRLKSASGGTTSTSTPTDIGSTIWRTNPAAGNDLMQHILISYTDPTTSLAWTPTGTNSLDNMQIGVANLTANDIDVSTLWALVEYVPAVGGSSSIKKLSGVAQASQKKVSGVAQASIKKVSGVANV